MINVNIICVGKLKEKYLKDACAEYIKRLTAFCKLNTIEISPVLLSDNPSKAEIENALKSEGLKILEKIPNNSMVYAMCIEGKQRTSAKLSEEISKIAIDGVSNITFIIGGSFGLSDEVKNRSNQKLSMSDMTFPHQLARVMLLEQIYRAFQISSGGKYHK
ncbi:MAG: 23S rRNA (pseudouridine(1915)-N(3))-methyltransferase RlmH [Clostridiales bacterium]|nr:23S rRNA (pseudouridine(1915)-N(3))-methyltransferase RlmH [Clostridiales bacterium]